MKNLLIFLLISFALSGCHTLSNNNEIFIWSIFDGARLDEIFGDFNQIQDAYGETLIYRQGHKEYLCYLQGSKSVNIIFYRTISEINGFIVTNSINSAKTLEKCANLKTEKHGEIESTILMMGKSQSEIFSTLQLKNIKSGFSDFEIRINRKLNLRKYEYDQYTTVKFHFSDNKLTTLEVWQTVTN